MALFLTLGNGLIGFADDSIKAVKKRNLGLTAKQKLAGQAVISVIFCIALKVFADIAYDCMDSFYGYYRRLGNGLLSFRIPHYCGSNQCR